MSENFVDGSASRPWYRCKWVWIIGLPVLVVLVSIAVHQYNQYQIQYQYNFHRPIEVTYEPWQVLDPGRAVENPLKFEVVQEGGGAVVEAGDLVQLTLQWRSAQRRDYDHKSDWWIWVGFRTEKETPFHSNDPRLVSAFVGLKEGEGVKFLESPRRNESAGNVYINPFGSYNYYAGSKSGHSDKSMAIPVPTGPQSGSMTVRIKKVFKGQLKYRTVHLYDGTWYESCTWWGGESRKVGCEIIKTPREGWVDEARYDGVSADGKKATFQYGPVETHKEKWTGGDMRGWPRDEWKKLPIGVQVE
ncbi:hypothetical protein AGMMS50256_09020 [Betaproteobacteria bacterium]|nr:hypothetical protein AGMMS50256_09020 [Betaproteobacteria bacterium]